MGQHAVELARAAGFTGVGAVEFLLDEHGRFWLTDMDTRAQAAPAVTEMVSGLDLVEWQLRIAGGDRLPYRQEHLNVQGHAIEVHLCAEDDAFLPQAGRVQVLRPPLVNEARGPGARLRFDHELREGLELGPGGDPRLGTLVAHAATREQAIARLATALDALQVLGLATNRRLLAACLRHREFAAGEVNVDFLALHAGAMRRELAAEERRAVPEAALAVLLPQGPAPALAWPFPRPWRVRHRGEVLDVTVCEAEAGPVPPVQVAAVGPGRWHVQSGCVDLFLEDASYCPP
jgi:3-methylcrotonyl-CoA carboxylase alpha subunit/geranyl-CoA carboxylase alpha subunit